MASPRPAQLDILLHPQRFEIGRVFEKSRRLTVRELADRLPDIPISSLYRHVARMTEAGMLIATSERRTGFPRDVVFEFRDQPLAREAAGDLDGDDIRALVRRVNLAAFDDLTTYLDGKPDVVADGTTALHTFRRITPDDAAKIRDFAAWIASLPEDPAAPGEWNGITIARFPAPPMQSLTNTGDTNRSDRS